MKDIQNGYEIVPKVINTKHSKNIATLTIMAKVSIVLDKRTTNAAGLHPLKIRITHNNSNASRTTSYYASAETWDESKQRIVRKANNAAKINSILDELVEEINVAIRELNKSKKLRIMRASDIFTCVYGKTVAEQRDVSFNAILHEYANACRKPKYAESFLYTERIIMDFVESFNPYIDKLFFDDIDYSFVYRFDKWLDSKSCEKKNQTGVKMNSKAVHLVNIRTLWNYAIKMKIAEYANYPFRDFKIRRPAKSEIKYLPLDSMHKLLELDFSNLKTSQGMELARDFFMLSFYFAGINPIDLFSLPKPVNGVICYTRQKIEWREPQKVKLFIPAAAQPIIDKYSDGPNLLNFDQHFINFDSFYSFVRHRLDRIGVLINEPDMTLYWSRYTWSTYATKLGAQEFVIDKMLGHTPRTLLGQRYAKFEWEDGAILNQRVIEYATQGVNQKSVLVSD